MGAPKQKWTPEEEAALKAGVLKYGPGKWLKILKDPDFSGVLYLRSNVDLKDKWRNIAMMANGWGSREKRRLAVKRMILAPLKDENSVNVTSAAESNREIAEVSPLATSSGSPKCGGSRRSIGRLDNLIIEAISNLKELGGSNKTTIAAYIEDQYWVPPNFKRLLSAELKYLTATGKLIKMTRRYKMAPKLTSSDRRRNLAVALIDSSQRICAKVDQNDMNICTRSQIDLELANMRSVPPQEAAAAACQAVAEADAAISVAEEAAREAEPAAAQAVAVADTDAAISEAEEASMDALAEAARVSAEADTVIAESEEAPKEVEAAEADAEAAQALAEVAMRTLQGRSIPRMLVNMVKKFVGM